MQAYSLDLRQRVVAAYENGLETIPEVAERFEVSDSFIKKLLRRNACRTNTESGCSKPS
jgi:transposase